MCASVTDAAVNYHAERRGNCAQSVAAGYAEKTGKRGELVDELKRCGGGNAPGGMCGALYAALQIAGDDNQEKVKQHFGSFTDNHFLCKEIRGGNIIPCRECVRHAAEAIEDLA